MKEIFENLKSVITQSNKVIEQYIAGNKFSEEQAVKALYEKSEAVQIMYESGFISEKTLLEYIKDNNPLSLPKEYINVD